MSNYDRVVFILLKTSMIEHIIMTFLHTCVPSGQGKQITQRSRPQFPPREATNFEGQIWHDPNPTRQAPLVSKPIVMELDVEAVSAEAMRDVKTLDVG